MSSSPTMHDSSTIELRKRLQDIHDNERVKFDWKSVLDLSERIMKFVTSETDDQNGYNLDNHDTEYSYKIPDALRSLLQKISCVFTCKCSGGDRDASTMEVLKLLSSYDWEAKIAIVVASFVAEYAHFRHMINHYNEDRVGMLVATLKQVTVNVDENVNAEISSSFKMIVEHSIEATNVIAKFSDLPSKHITSDVTAWRNASDEIPIAGYSVTKAVIACVARLTSILHQTETSSYSETLNLDSFTKTISSTRKELIKHFEECNIYVETKKETKYMEKLRVKFHKSAVYKNNRKILQLIFNSKLEGVLPIVHGTNESEEKIKVDAFQGKTVLLLISDVTISGGDEISILSKLYTDSKKKQKLNYEIVWFPIGEDEEYKKVEVEMPWYKLQTPSSVKRGMVKYVREEWKYSTKTILVALDEYGKVGHLNALNMVLAWGNDAYPFTCARESEIWSSQKWGLDLVIGEFAKDNHISRWKKESKITILFGGDDNDWVRKFVAEVKKVEAGLTEIEVGMMYTSTNTSVSEEVEQILTGKSERWSSETTTHFMKRIETMARSGSVVTTASESIRVQLQTVYRAHQSEIGWVIISHADGAIAVGEGPVMLDAFKDFDKWNQGIENNNFVAALNNYLAGLPVTIPKHVCACKECGAQLPPNN